MSEEEESVYSYLSFRPTEEQLSVEEEANRAKIEEYRTTNAEIPDEGSKIRISRAVSNPNYFPESRMNYVEFSVQGFEVSDCVSRWIKSLWGTPKGFATTARVPARFSRVFVPHLVTEVSKNAVMTYNEVTYGVGIFQGRVWNTVERKDVHSSVTRVTCIAANANDCDFYSDFDLSSPDWKSVPIRSLRNRQIPDRFVEDAELVPYRWVMHAREDYNRKSIWQKTKCFFRTGEKSRPRSNYIFPDSYVLKYSGQRNSDILWRTSQACQRDLGEEISRTWSRLQGDPQNRRSNLNVQYMRERSRSTIVFLPFYTGMYEAVNNAGNRVQFRVAVYGADESKVSGIRPKGTFTGVLRDLTMRNG